MARAELAKYNALVFQDKKLEAAGVKKGRLSPEVRAVYEKKIKDLGEALDTFHRSVAGYNRTKAMSVLLFGACCLWRVSFDEFLMFFYSLSFVLLVAFALMMFFQPWSKHFDNSKDLTYEEYATLGEEPTETLKETAEAAGISDEL